MVYRPLGALERYMRREKAPAEQSWHTVAQSGQAFLSTYVKRLLLCNAKEGAKDALVVNYYNISSGEHLPKVWIKACTAVSVLLQTASTGNAEA